MRARGTGQCDFHPNPKINRFVRTPIFVPYIVYIPLIVASCYYGAHITGISFWGFVVLFITGWLIWTFIEYAVHRWLYHTYGGPKWLSKIRDKSHWIHHRHPKDSGCLASPPYYSLLISAIIFGVLYLVSGRYAFILYGGVASGYLIYLLIHYLQHVMSRPPSFFKPLWMHHVIHHYHDPNINFGVSSPLWDIIFGTLKTKIK